MNAIDILIIVVGGAALVMGFAKGIVAQMGQLVGVVAGVAVSRMFGPVVSTVFAGGSETSAATDVAGYIVAFVMAYLAVWLIFNLARKTVHGLHLGIVDRAAGGVFKAAEWLLVLSIVLNIWFLIKNDEGELRQSDKPWRGAVIDYAPALLGYLADMRESHNNGGACSVDNKHKDNSENAKS